MKAVFEIAICAPYFAMLEHPICVCEQNIKFLQTVVILLSVWSYALHRIIIVCYTLSGYSISLRRLFQKIV